MMNIRLRNINSVYAGNGWSKWWRYFSASVAVDHATALPMRCRILRDSWPGYDPVPGYFSIWGGVHAVWLGALYRGDEDELFA